MTPIPYLAGPTGVGKSGVALDVALRIGAEIVSADSRQVFSELSIGTDRPPPSACQDVPHHLAGDRSVTEGISAGVFARDAEAAISAVRSRDQGVVVVGGSTLYLKALVHGLADIPPVPADIRDQLNARLRAEGPQALFSELLRADPTYAATLDPTKSQRIVRGLEVFEATGRPLSSYFESVPKPRHRFDIVVLDRDRADLYARIDRRVDHMIGRGLVDEVRGLVGAGYTGDEPALQTIGYREVFAHLRGDIPEDEMIRQIKMHSRRYAKRQLTWYRRIPEITWINLSLQPRAAVVDTLVSRWGSSA